MKQIWRHTWLFVTGVVSACATVSIHAVETNQPPDFSAPAKVDLQPVPKIKLGPRPSLEPTEATNILRLIRNLAKIHNEFTTGAFIASDYGFPPVIAAWRNELLTTAERQAQQPDDITKLVELGPRALPFLLASLDDPTPTQWVITGQGRHSLEFVGGLNSNPGNDLERKVLGTSPMRKPWLSSGKRFPTYTVTVGDVCFDIIGRIVGREYRCVSSVFPSDIRIQSPVHDTNLAAQVRAIWSGGDPDEKVFRSLLVDFASHGFFDGHSLDSWETGNFMQVTAVPRLLYYYPAETTNLIAKRLHGLNVGKNSLQREVKNGVRTDEFIGAVAWLQEPAIRAELRRIFRITKDPNILIRTAALMGSADEPEILQRFGKLISSLPDTEYGPYGDGYRLLVALGYDCGDEARPVYERYLKHASIQRKQSMTQVLEEVHRDWSVALLGPLLADTTPAGGDYAVVAGQNEPRLPIRVCDWAAEAISRDNPELKFEMAGQHADLDRQIQIMHEQIQQHEY